MSTLLNAAAWIFGGIALVCIATVIIIASIPDPTVDIEREKP
jgi:hypothetical protein